MDQVPNQTPSSMETLGNIKKPAETGNVEKTQEAIEEDKKWDTIGEGIDAPLPNNGEESQPDISEIIEITPDDLLATTSPAHHEGTIDTSDITARAPEAAENQENDDQPDEEKRRQEQEERERDEKFKKEMEEAWKRLQEKMKQIKDGLIGELKAYFEANRGKAPEERTGSLPALAKGFEGTIEEALNEASDPDDFIEAIRGKMSDDEKKEVEGRIRAIAEGNN